MTITAIDASTGKTEELDVDQVTTLAADLIRQLSEHPGDDRAVCDVLVRWLDLLDSQALSMVAMAAMRMTFGECLTPHPDSVPAGALTLDTNLIEGNADE